MIWFSADFHISHNNILKYCNRPFSNIQDHDNHIITQINKCVKSNDTLYFLGDLLFANKKYYAQNLFNLLSKINCNDIRWLHGNHDPSTADLRLRIMDDNSLWKKIRVQGSFYEENLYNKPFVMCHYAMAIWNKSHRGAYHIYGHSHSTAEESLDELFPGRRSMDVGIDNAKKLLGEYRPFSINEVISILDRKYNDNQLNIKNIDHHIEKT